MPIDNSPGGTDFIDKSGNGMGVDLGEFNLISELLARSDANAVIGYGYAKGFTKIDVPFGILTQTGPVDVYGSGIVQGETGAIAPGGASSLVLPIDTSGIRVHYVNTKDESAYDAASTRPNASGSIIRQLLLKGSKTTPNVAHPGIKIRSPTAIEDVFIDGFAGHGIDATAQLQSTVNPNYGNTSSSQIWRVTAQNCGLDGFHAEGADSNIFLWMGSFATSNLGYGFADKSVNGGVLLACHGAANVLGNYYTDPAQTSANPLLLGCYNEGGSSPSTFSPRTLRVGGSWNGDETGGGFVYASGNRVRVNAFGCDGNFDASGTTMSFGPHTGVTDLTVFFNSMGGQSELHFYRNDLAIDDGYITNALGKFYINATQGTRFRFAGTDIVDVVTGGINLLTGKTLSVNAQQVVGARGASLPADATDLASAIALANAIKSRMKTTGGHGLVAD